MKNSIIKNDKHSINEDANKAFSVSEINGIIADILNAGLPVAIWVEGEISNLSVASSGHRYFSLKDKDSVIACALFKQSSSLIKADILTNLKNGDKVTVKSRVTLYKPRGSYQLLVSDIQLSGYGELARAYVELKDKLQKLGCTSQENKKIIPKFPKEVAVITSSTGAAIRDVLITLKNNAPFVNVTVYPTLVQGEQATSSLLTAIAKAQSDNRADVILLVRGGGSLEDLQAFNDERVAMAVYNSIIPVITGVGHETDISICDFVSDYRAATPTAAAEKAVPNKTNLERLLSIKLDQLVKSITKNKIQKQQHSLVQLQQRLLLQHPKRKYLSLTQKADELEFRLKKSITNILLSENNKINAIRKRIILQSHYKKIEYHNNYLINIQKQLKNNITNRTHIKSLHLEQLQTQLNQIINRKSANNIERVKGFEARIKLLSPLGILDRGYSIIYDENGQIVQSKNQIKNLEKLILRFKDGISKIDITNSK